MDRALSQAGRRGGHTLARRARLRHAPEPLPWPGQDRPPAGLHGRGGQRLTGGALAEWTTTRQDPRDPLRRPGSRRLNSPTVSGTCPTHHGCDRRRAAHRRLETGERGADPDRSGGRATARQTADRAGQAEWLVLILVRRTPAHVKTVRRLNRLKPI